MIECPMCKYRFEKEGTIDVVKIKKETLNDIKEYIQTKLNELDKT
jgi:hypothetical protein